MAEAVITNMAFRRPLLFRMCPDSLTVAMKVQVVKTKKKKAWSWILCVE